MYVFAYDLLMGQCNLQVLNIDFTTSLLKVYKFN